MTPTGARAAGARPRGVVTAEVARRRRNVLFAAVVAFAALCATWWIVTGPLARVSDVAIRGYDGPDKAALEKSIRIVATHRGTVFQPPAEMLRTVAKRFPWVEDIRVERNLPRGLTVRIVQAQAGVVAVPATGPRMLLSSTGRVLGPAGPGTPEVARVRMPGASPEVGTVVTRPTVRAALQFASALDPEVSARVLALRHTRGALVGRLSGGPELRLGLPEDLREKAVALQLVLNQLSPQDEREAAYIDLSVPSRPAVGTRAAATLDGAGTSAQSTSAGTVTAPAGAAPSTATTPPPAAAPDASAAGTDTGTAAPSSGTADAGITGAAATPDPVAPPADAAGATAPESQATAPQALAPPTSVPAPEPSTQG